MTVTEFFQYLFGHDATRNLAVELAEVHALRVGTVRRAARPQEAMA